MGSFPLPFHSLCTLRGGRQGPFVIAAIFTDGYRDGAERLAASCDRLGLAYEIHEVPAVHKSISVRGSDDASYTKPNFIRHLLAAHRKPILYLDADCEILSPLVLINQLVQKRCDFAIYNWGADEHNERFFPVPVGEEDRPSGRYYRYVGCFEFRSDDQLVPTTRRWTSPSTTCRAFHGRVCCSSRNGFPNPMPVSPGGFMTSR
jgi:hypothetical protein